MPWPKTGATQYHAQLGLPDKGRAIKGLVICNNRDIEPLDLQNGLALGCYQPSPEVLIVKYTIVIDSCPFLGVEYCPLQKVQRLPHPFPLSQK